MKRDQIRCQFYVPAPLAQRLEGAIRKSGATKSAVLAQALGAWLERGEASELDHQFAQRLDRINRALSRLDRSSDVLVESLALFIRYMLTVNAPLAEGDDEARAIGNERFKQFIERVGRQLASGTSSFPGGDT